MSFWQLVENSPEWVGVFATSLFAIITIIILIRQVAVMRWQARTSSRHEDTQNNLLRLQLAHEFVTLLNAEREKILKLVYELGLLAGDFRWQQSVSDPGNWRKLQNVVHELHTRLRILDSRTYSDPYGKWYFELDEYVEDVLKAVHEDSKLRDDDGYSGPNPSERGKDLLKTANEKNNPMNIRVGIESAMRMEVFEFKQKWDAVLK